MGREEGYQREGWEKGHTPSGWNRRHRTFPFPLSPRLQSPARRNGNSSLDADKINYLVRLHFVPPPTVPRRGALSYVT